MKTIQGFVTKYRYTNNNQGVVSPFFELSPLALTYSKNRTEYLNDEYAGTTLHVFAAMDSVANAPFILSEYSVKNIFKTVALVMEHCQAQALNFNSARFISYVMAFAVDYMVDFKHGAYVNTEYPEWISWTENDAANTEIRIWLNNNAFLSQYANYDITVIPPITDPNLFFGNYASTAALLANRTLSDFMGDVQAAKDEIPETYIRSLSLKFYNKNLVGTVLPQYTEGDWGFLIYGIAGDNIDAMKDAIANYLLTNTSHTEEEWQVILPDVFKRTEFVLFPRWDKISILNSTPQSSLYSSIFKLSEMASYINSHQATGWEDAVAYENMEVLPFEYKAITVGVLPGLANDAGVRSLSTLFPDYLPLSTSELDFNRMSIATRDWVVLASNAIVSAESMTEFSTLQSPFRRVKRQGVLYLSFLYDNINYLVRARSND